MFYFKSQTSKLFLLFPLMQIGADGANSLVRKKLMPGMAYHAKEYEQVKLLSWTKQNIFYPKHFIIKQITECLKFVLCEETLDLSCLVWVYQK